MRQGLACVLVVLALGCDRSPGKAGAPGTVPLTDAQAVETVWKRWQECVAGGDGNGAWSCLSKRSKADRATLYRADAARFKGLSGAELETEARAWGVGAAAIQGMDAEGLAALALGRELRRLDRSTAGLTGKISTADIQGDVAVLRLAPASGRADAVAFVREDGGWRLDDAESRRAAAALVVPR
jgi:hypothetical protein